MIRLRKDYLIIKMAVIKIWSVHGTMNHSLGTVIDYVNNPEKTGEKVTDRQTIKYQSDDLQGLVNVMDYAMNENKTENKLYVSGLNCDPKYARDQMIMTKERFNKTDKRIAYHMIQSFAPGEVTPQLAHSIGIEYAQKMFGDKYEVVIATHLNTDSIHNHFIINSVSFEDGKKYHMGKGTVQQMRKLNDDICKAHNLSVPVKQLGRGTYGYQNIIDFKKDGGELNTFAKNIDEVIEMSVTRQQFYDEMKRRGYVFDFSRMHPRIFFPGKDRARRWETISQIMGEEYSQEAVEERIAGNWIPKKREPQDDPRQIFFGSDHPTFNYREYKVVYFKFISGLKFIQMRPRTNRELYFLLGDELKKMDRLIEQQSLMIRNNLNTSEEVLHFRNARASMLSSLTDERTELRKKLKTAIRNEDLTVQDEVRNNVANMTERIKQIRNEVKICDRLLTDAPVIIDKLSVIDGTNSSDEKTKGKEITYESRN